MRQTLFVSVLLALIAGVAALFTGIDLTPPTPKPDDSTSLVTGSVGPSVISPSATAFFSAGKPTVTRTSNDGDTVLRWVAAAAGHVKVGMDGAKDQTALMRDGTKPKTSPTPWISLKAPEVKVPAPTAAAPAAEIVAASNLPKQDYGAALKWYAIAANNDPEARYSLGVTYRDGAGVTQDYVKAVQLFIAAADQGDPHAQAALGELYAAGKGVAVDLPTAYMWLSLAAGSCAPLDECKRAEAVRDNLAATMTAADFERAQKLIEARTKSSLTVVSRS